MVGAVIRIIASTSHPRIVARRPGQTVPAQQTEWDADDAREQVAW
jgi:hypothetical protein